MWSWTVEYLRRRRSVALEAGGYTIEVVEGRTVELVTAEEPEGDRLDIPAQSTLWGRIEFGLYVAPDPDRRRRVAVVGRAGTTIVDHLGTLDDFDHDPWTSGQVSGQILFGALQQTAGRRAVLRDGDAFPVFRHAVTGVEPLVVRTIERLRRHIDEQAADRVADVVRHVFERVLKELADLENPMHTLVGDEPGTGGLLARRADGAGADDPVEALPPEPRLDELEPDQSVAVNPDRSAGSGAGQPVRAATCPRSLPIPNPATRVLDSKRMRAPSSTTTAIPTTCSSRTTNRHSSTTCPPWWPRSTSSTTTLVPRARTWPRRWSACW